MKLNMKILALFSLFLIATCMTVVVAEETSTFTVPDGFKVNDSFNKTTVITNGSATIIITETDGDISAATKEVTDKGFTLTNETTYKFDDKTLDIHQQNYNKDNSHAYIYDFKKDNKNYVITFYPPEGQTGPSDENNPVTTMIQTLKLPFFFYFFSINTTYFCSIKM